MKKHSSALPPAAVVPSSSSETTGDATNNIDVEMLIKDKLHSLSPHQHNNKASTKAGNSTSRQEEAGQHPRTDPFARVGDVMAETDLPAPMPRQQPEQMLAGPGAYPVEGPHVGLNVTDDDDDDDSDSGPGPISQQADGPNPWPDENGAYNTGEDRIGRSQQQDGTTTDVVAQAVNDSESPTQIATPMDPKSNQTKIFQTALPMAAAAALFLVIVGVTVAAVVCKGGACSGANNKTPPSRTEAIISQLEQSLGIGYFGEEAADTPRSKALEWILYNDTALGLKPNADNLLQRFVLTLFYFETTIHGPWWHCNPPKRTGNQSRTCSYNQSPSQSGTANRWLTGSSECTWAGLTCDDDGKLVDLSCKKYGLQGTLPPELGMLTQLTSLSLIRNQLYGALPREIGQLLELQYVSIPGNQFSGTVPTSLFESCVKLTHLSVRRNPITGTIPTEVGLLQQIEFLSFSETSISGTLPLQLFSLQKLGMLDLGWINTTGTIPTEVGNLAGLYRLGFQNNRASGTIPSEFGALQYLRTLELSHSQGIGGAIPRELFHLSALQTLALNDCNLTGTLSTTIGHLSALETLDLANNELTGSVPEQISLTNLRYIAVNGNQFTGSFPSIACYYLPGSARIVADCTLDEITGLVAMPCECCTQCCDPSADVCSNVV